MGKHSAPEHPHAEAKNELFWPCEFCGSKKDEVCISRPSGKPYLYSHNYRNRLWFDERERRRKEVAARDKAATDRHIARMYEQVLSDVFDKRYGIR